jgi:RHS repeat-associated protein
VNQQWNGAGQLQQVADGSGYLYMTPQSTYWPNGTPQSIWRGNGVASGVNLNNRLQPRAWNVSRIGANAPGTFSANTGFLSKELCYGPAMPSPSPNAISACPSFGVANSGNIWQIVDPVASRTQTFSYDSLNRLASFLQADGSRQQTYQYDSFGNLNQTSPGTFQDNVTILPSNQLQGVGYDAAGNTTAYSNGLFTTSYSFDAENRLTNVNNGAALYTYDADGNRVRKDVGNEWTEYIPFNGQIVAERSDDGTWSDYIFANGQRLARADNYDIRIHMSGTNCPSCVSSPNTFAGVTSLTAANSYTIRDGDVLTWRQYQVGATTGGLFVFFTDKTNALDARDTDGQLIDQDTTMNSWHMRTVNLSPYAVGPTPKTIQLIDPFQWTSAPAGNWDIYYDDILLVSADGSFIPIYSRSMMGLTTATNPAVSNFSAVTEKQINGSTSNSDPAYAVTATTYYHGDQVGSAQLMTNAAGWPIFTTEYYPFGVEGAAQALTPPGTGNHYKFTGKERDSESNLDYFGARYYLNALGRFMSPDWSAKVEPVPYSKLDNPQSLNLYSYTLNNPLSNVDTDGHACEALFFNTGSGFCTRATEYGRIDARPGVQSQTRFFAAANAVSQALADVATPISGIFVSSHTASFLEGVGENLLKLNESEANAIQNGSLSGPNLDQQLVHNEQSSVQGQLDSFQQSDPTGYTKAIGEINGSLNRMVTRGLQQLTGTDRAYAGVLDGVRKNLGRNIDFSKQGDREAIGNGLINQVRQTGGCRINASRQPGC